MAVDLYYNMRYMALFSFLLHEENFYISKKSSKIKKRDITLEYENEDVAKEYIGITKITYDKSTENGVHLIVKYQSNKNTIDDSFEVLISYAGIVHFDFKKIFSKIERLIEPGYRTILQKIYKVYFKTCIKSELKYNLGINTKCGWFYDEKDTVFRAVNIRSNTMAIDKIIFNGLLNSRTIEQENIEAYCTKTDNLKCLFTFLTSGRSIVFMLAYCIHSIFWYYNYGYKTFTDSYISNSDPYLFSLCVFGKDVSHAKILSNILLNLFDLPKNSKWPTIPSTIHVSASSISDTKFLALQAYKSIPIIVTTKSNKFTRSSSIIKKFQRKREQGFFHLFPVFISESPVYADEMVNCCIDDVTINFEEPDVFYTVHSQLCFLLYFFINYLSEISNPETHIDRTDTDNFRIFHKQIIENAYDDIEWFDSHIPEILMSISFRCFCYYLEKTPLNIYVNKLLDNFTSLVNGEPLVTEQESLSNIDYVGIFHDFINKYSKDSKSNNWLFEGHEQRGSKEECYYLDNKEGYNKFISFLKEAKKPPITKRNFVKLMKDNHLLKSPESGTSNTMKRNGKYVYVILKNSLQ